jgi:hypothetical protein
MCTAHALAALPLLLLYHRIYVRQLFLSFGGFGGFGGPAAAFSAFKISAQKGLF